MKKTTPSAFFLILLSITLALTAGFLSAAPRTETISTGAPPTPSQFTGSEWDFVWSDEFNGNAVDSSKWIFETGDGCPNLCGWGNAELQSYSPNNATIQDLPGGGRGLVIEARQESSGAYTSARMKTQGLHSWTYGRFEARIRLPEGQGIWPAFWMLGDNITSVNWPASGEIDIMELVGHEPSTVHGTLHYGAPHRFTGSGYTLPSGKFSDSFYNFAIEWEPGEIRWYVNDTLYQTQNAWTSSIGDFPAPFDRNFFFLLNVAVGGRWPGNPDDTTQFPQRMYVDYVRVYTREGIASLPVPLFPETPTSPVSSAPSTITDGNIFTDSLGAGFSFLGVFDNGMGNTNLNETDLRVGDSGSAIKIELTGSAGWGGGFITTGAIDVSEFTNLIFVANTADLGGADYLELKVEDSETADNNNGVYEPEDTFSLLNILSANSGITREEIEGASGWFEYTVPLSILTEGDGTTALNTSAIRNIGFWNPQGNGRSLQGAYYIDNIRFE